MGTEDVNAIATEPDALDQSLALNRIVTQLLEERNNDFKRLRILLLISIIANLLIVTIFLFQHVTLVREYQDILDSLKWEETVSTTTTTEIVQDTEGAGNNAVQVGDNGQIVLGESEDMLDGTTDSADYPDNDTNQS